MQEIHGKISEKKYFKKLGIFYEFRYKIYDAFNEKYFTKVRIFVPVPETINDQPCILVGLSNSSVRMLLRFLDTTQLQDYLTIDPDVKFRLDDALTDADYRYQNIRMVQGVLDLKTMERRADADQGVLFPHLQGEQKSRETEVV